MDALFVVLALAVFFAINMGMARSMKELLAAHKQICEEHGATIGALRRRIEALEARSL